MKKFLITVLVILLIILIVIIVLPARYTIEESVDINASQGRVFNTAKNIAAWHALGMFSMMGSMPKMSALPKGAMKIPKEMQDKIPGGMDPESLMSGMGKMQSLMTAVKLTVKSATPPDKIVLKMAGGPLDGMEPEITVSKTAAASSRVLYRESYAFEGFFSGVKSLAVRIGSGKMVRGSLAKLKLACEGRQGR